MDLKPEWTTVRYEVDLKGQLRQSVQGITGVEAADWVIEAVGRDLKNYGAGLNSWESQILRMTERELDQLNLESQPQLVSLVNRTVVSLRRLIDFSLSQGSGSVAAREGLWMPVQWEKRYQVLYQTEFPWMIAAIFQWALLGNPFNNETAPWRSRTPRPVVHVMDPSVRREPSVVWSGVASSIAALMSFFVPDLAAVAFSVVGVVVVIIGTIVWAAVLNVRGAWTLGVGAALCLAGLTVGVYGMNAG